MLLFLAGVQGSHAAAGLHILQPAEDVGIGGSDMEGVKFRSMTIIRFHIRMIMKTQTVFKINYHTKRI
jgi:hypothetical protein